MTRDWGRQALGTTLESLTGKVHDSKDALIRELKRMGAKDQLVMFLTGAAGCRKSATMEAAQFYAHNQNQ